MQHIKKNCLTICLVVSTILLLSSIIAVFGIGITLGTLFIVQGLIKIPRNLSFQRKITFLKTLIVIYSILCILDIGVFCIVCLDFWWQIKATSILQLLGIDSSNIELLAVVLYAISIVVNICLILFLWKDLIEHAPVEHNTEILNSSDFWIMDMDGQEDRSRENTLNEGSQPQQQQQGRHALSLEERLRFAQMAQNFLFDNLIRQGQQEGAAGVDNQGNVRQPTLWIQRDGQLFPLALQLFHNFNPNQVFGGYHNIEQQLNNWETMNSTLNSHDVASVEDGKECAICYEAYEKKSDAAPNHKLFTLPCGHTFHATCLRFAMQNTGKKCPYCRQLIQKKITSPKSSNQLSDINHSVSSNNSIQAPSNQQIMIQQQQQS